MLKTQSPVPRETLQEWTEDRYGIFMNIQSADDKVLKLYNEELFPEISVLFAGDDENFVDTAEICGMYDHRTCEFRFVSGQLASIVNGISEAECGPDSDDSEKIYEKICLYAKEAVEQRGYTFENSRSEKFAAIQQTVQSSLSDLADYAALLSARGERDAVLDVRDLALEMLHFWRDGVYDTYEKGYARVEQQYTEKFDAAVESAGTSKQTPAFRDAQAANLLKSLAIHAEEVTQCEAPFSVWECCHVAKWLQAEYPQHKELFCGEFTVDEHERFMEFGSRDEDHLKQGRLLGRRVLVFNSPVLDEQVPEGWHSYHLAGRNVYCADKLLKAVPENGYVGTVLSPHVLIRASYQSRQLQEPLRCFGDYVSLTEFCEKYHLPQPDMSGIFPEQQEQASAPQTMGGMAL